MNNKAIDMPWSITLLFSVEIVICVCRSRLNEHGILVSIYHHDKLRASCNTSLFEDILKLGGFDLNLVLNSLLLIEHIPCLIIKDLLKIWSGSTCI